jgi:hypothetical protein
MAKKAISAIFIFLLFTSFSLLFSGELKGVNMSESIEIEGQNLVLNGMALRKKYVFAKVYVAGLYLPKKEKDAGKILSADEARSTMLHFLRGVKANQISDAWFTGLKENTPNHSQDLKKQFDLLATWMEAVKKGERMTFTYIPGKGTLVNVKSKLKGTIAGKEFADALFACWIGPKPGPGEGFKNSLLGK